MNQALINETVDQWIQEQRPDLLRAMRASDPWDRMSEEEIEDAREFIRWTICQDFAVLLLIPVHTKETEIWFSDDEEFKESACNTNHFVRMQAPFDGYGYWVKKVLQKVKDLGIVYSCLTSAEGREQILGRYEKLVNREFRDGLMKPVERSQGFEDIDEKMRLKAKVVEVSRRIMKCAEVWQKYSTGE